MSHPVVEARRREQAELVNRARVWAQDLTYALPDLVSMVVFGSVARGDFNKWSDIDVLVVSDHLPDDYLARMELVSPVPAGIQPVVWTPGELRAARERRNPIAVEADTAGIPVLPAGV